MSNAFTSRALPILAAALITSAVACSRQTAAAAPPTPQPAAVAPVVPPVVAPTPPPVVAPAVPARPTGYPEGVPLMPGYGAVSSSPFGTTLDYDERPAALEARTVPVLRQNGWFVFRTSRLITGSPDRTLYLCNGSNKLFFGFRRNGAGTRLAVGRAMVDLPRTGCPTS